MLVLFETAAGFAIFKVNFPQLIFHFGRPKLNLAVSSAYPVQLLDEKKLRKVDDLYKSFETPEGASKV